MPAKVNPQASGSGAGLGSNGEVVVITAYDLEDKADHGDVQGKLTSIAQLAYDPENVDKWVRRLERRMETGGIGSQWTKRLVLEAALPPQLHNDLDDLFDKRKEECGQIYKECKALLLKIHGPRPDRDLKLALQMTQLEGTPSQTAKKLIKLICKDKKPLVNCCCAILVFSRWNEMLPNIVKAAVSSFNFKTESDRALDTADEVWHSIQAGAPSAYIAAMADLQAGPANHNSGRTDADASAAPVAQAVPEVAAFAGRGQGRGQGRGGRGNQRGGRRGGHAPAGSQAQPDQGPLPDNLCKMHKRHKKRRFIVLTLRVAHGLVISINQWTKICSEIASMKP